MCFRDDISVKEIRITKQGGESLPHIKSEEAVTVEIGRILPTEAAMILNVSPQFVRVGMQQGKLPIGTAIKMSSIWTYHISEKLLQEYSGKNVEREIKKIRQREESQS